MQTDNQIEGTRKSLDLQLHSTKKNHLRINDLHKQQKHKCQRQENTRSDLKNDEKLPKSLHNNGKTNTALQPKCRELATSVPLQNHPQPTALPPLLSPPHSLSDTQQAKET